MNIYAFLALINGLVSLLIGIFVYTQNRASASNKYFSVFAFSVVVWSIGYFFWQIATIEVGALFWVRVLMAGAILIPILNFHFILSFLGTIRRQLPVLLAGYSIFTFFFLANFTSYFVAGVEPKLEFVFWPNPGPLFHPFLGLWFLYVLYGALLLLKERAKTFGARKSQIDYILFATLIGYGGGVTNFFLWYDIPISLVGIFGPALYVGIVAYAMVTHKLFGIRLFVTQFLVTFLSLLLLINFLLSRSLFEFLWKGTLFFAFLVSGFLLIKSVLNEIRIREQLEEALVKLKELDKAKSEFLSIASHQLRAPLTAIKGYLSMLMEGTYGQMEERQKHPVQNVYDSNERMIKLVNDLLNISRIESGRVEMNWEETNIEQLASEVVQELQVKAHEKRLDLILQKPPESIPLVRVDKEKIRNVIMNLVDNAIHYTEKGTVLVRLKIENLKLKIEVSDTGLGMAKDEIERLFQSFTRGETGNRTWAEGSGLGLYIAKQFAALHKGRIWAESKGQGQGSTFIVELPLQG